ncbi:hypothetical protein MPH47_09635 [Psychrobacillus psychrodurans]|uniref:hypothetical protein n=1 Tax=Psychrobacillus psychrodurans TaxID=126157 RepID=UPI001F4E3742|nr:hypothetical protein [Psychrobacillus psychrodurans]MCK1997477.1 hypothetical protein [Psychrobacillus psychrodurans]
MLLLAKRDYLEDLNALSFSPWRKASLFEFTCGEMGFTCPQGGVTCGVSEILALGTSLLAEYMLLLAKRDYLEDLNANSFSPWRKTSLF